MNQKEGESDFWIIPTNEYRAQALKYFMINEDLDKLYWVVYTDLIPKLELQVLEINRGEITDWLEDAIEVEKEYLEELEKAEKMLD